VQSPSTSVTDTAFVKTLSWLWVPHRDLIW
jgi:hypothetical protein